MSTRRSEASIQKAVVTYARSQGCICIKQGGGGRFGSSGWPDYLILTPKGRAFLIEFKAPGGEPTVLQTQRHIELKHNKVAVYVIDNAEHGKFVVKGWL